jgi:cytochrome b561
MLTNTKNRYGLIAIILHWLIAALLVMQVVVGLTMANLPKGPAKFNLIGWHKEWGLLILLLVICRLVWRLSNITPQLDYIPRWEKIAARTAQWGFYGLLLALPITGWLMSELGGYPVSFFGLTLPDLIAQHKPSAQLFDTIHIGLAYALIVTFVLHTAAALKHYFIDRDDILQRMI